MWLYNGEEFTEEMINKNYGFVYIIKNLQTYKKYIGKKFFYSKRTLPPLKGKKRKRHIIKESNWKSYYGSSKSLHDDIKKYGKLNFYREIISIHPNKTETNYHELKLQIMLDVLQETDINGERVYYNENINRIFYPSDKYIRERKILHENYREFSNE